MALITLTLLIATAVYSPAPGRADPNYPVLLVHGGAGNPGNFAKMIERLKADGYRPYTVDLDLFGIDTVGNAGRIKAKVEEIRTTTGASKVHLVGHSMGGLSTRYYIKMLGGLDRVATYTAFGTPQHGHPANACRPQELVPDQCPRSNVMKDLNRDDDTPGSIYYTSIASKQAHPEEANGTWHPLDQGACLPLIDGGEHGKEPENELIYKAVKDGLNSICPTGWTNLPDGWTNLPDMTS
ncbi:MAG: esterase/lipase family protein [Pseudonocardiaceae bacterium]